MPARKWLLLLAAIAFVSGCAVENQLVSINFAGTRPVIKIGLVAPFEGRYREIGYSVIYGVRLAIREAAGSGPVEIELVAYNDSGRVSDAVEAAKSLIVDPDVVAVIGHWRAETTSAAAPFYDEAGLILVAPGEGAQADTSSVFLRYGASSHDLNNAANRQSEALWLAGSGSLTEDAARARAALEHYDAIWGGPMWMLDQFRLLAPDVVLSGKAQFLSSDRILEEPGDFPERYAALSAFAGEPGPLAYTAYDAAHEMIATIHEMGDTPRREDVFHALYRQLVNYEAPIYLYRWDEQGEAFLVEQVRP
jgi:ABC-type branched-subunit amino acid transport system substrate-binding protein